MLEPQGNSDRNEKLLTKKEEEKKTISSSTTILSKLFKNRKSWFFFLFETVQVITSVLDVGLDILVCLEFYHKERWTAFYASTLVFFIAQAAYAFLFAAAYGRNIHTTTGKVKAFLIAFPLAQIVPLFSWLESFHFEKVDKLLCYFNLTPTSLTFTEGDDATIDKVTVDQNEDSSLWAFGHRKFNSNIGFLVEAIVEAIPQAMIQTCAVVVYGEADSLIVISILMSVFVVSSKGYMLSYSINLHTFVFNALCVVADICGLISTLVWAFGACSASSLVSPEPDLVYETWFNFACICASLTGIGGLSLALFANFDDHIKTRLYAQTRRTQIIRLATGNVVFDLWFTRIFIWILALLPASVLILSLKTSALPLFYFHSVEPAHYSFPQVHRRMYDFINRGGPARASSRLYELNTFLRILYERAKITGATGDIFKTAARRENKGSMQVAREFVAGLQPKPTLMKRRNAILPIRQNISDETAESDRVEVRWENRKTALTRRLTWFEDKSAIWWFLNGAHKNTAVTDTPRWDEWKLDENSDRFLKIMGTILLFMSGIFLMLLAPALIVLAILGIAIPIIGPYRWLLASGPFFWRKLTFEVILGLTLSFVHIACVIGLLLLIPKVAEFQFITKDIVHVADYEEELGGSAFYQVGLDLVIECAYERHRRQIGREALKEHLEWRTNPDVTSTILSFLSDNPLPNEGF